MVGQRRDVIGTASASGGCQVPVWLLQLVSPKEEWSKVVVVASCGSGSAACVLILWHGGLSCLTQLR